MCMKNSKPPVPGSTVHTPVRLALRRRMRETGDNPEPGVFGEVVQLVRDKYSIISNTTSVGKSTII